MNNIRLTEGAMRLPPAFTLASYSESILQTKAHFGMNGCLDEISAICGPTQGGSNDACNIGLLTLRLSKEPPSKQSQTTGAQSVSLSARELCADAVRVACREN
jgi:hypothetical protein